MSKTRHISLPHHSSGLAVFDSNEWRRCAQLPLCNKSTVLGIKYLLRSIITLDFNQPGTQSEHSSEMIFWCGSGESAGVGVCSSLPAVRLPQNPVRAPVRAPRRKREMVRRYSNTSKYSNTAIQQSTHYLGGDHLFSNTLLCVLAELFAVTRGCI